MPHLRPASPTDIPAIVALTEEAYAEYLPLLGYPPVPVTEDYSPRVSAGEVWVLENKGELAALAVVETHADHLMLFSIAVASAHRGKGHGVAIMRWLEEKARELGKPEIWLYTNALMVRNIALYKGLGYEKTGRRPNPKRPQFTIVDMAKRL